MIKTFYIKYLGLIIKIKTWLTYIRYFKTKLIIDYLSSKFTRKKNVHTPEIENNQNRFDR
tara:strand:- start:510 stop:689 length:180 start_codon:yes stop_codon:yes gene_type:complete